MFVWTAFAQDLLYTGEVKKPQSEMNKSSQVISLLSARPLIIAKAFATPLQRHDGLSRTEAFSSAELVRVGECVLPSTYHWAQVAGTVVCEATNVSVVARQTMRAMWRLGCVAWICHEHHERTISTVVATHPHSACRESVF